MENDKSFLLEGKTILTKENGITRTEQATNKSVLAVRNEKQHLCGDCKNFENCQKVADIDKLTIDKYDFITNGAQVIDDSGKVDHFLVSNCKDFVREDERRISGHDAIMARQELMKNWYDAETIEEARDLQKQLNNREQQRISKGRK